MLHDYFSGALIDTDVLVIKPVRFDVSAQPQPKKITWVLSSRNVPLYVQKEPLCPIRVCVCDLKNIENSPTAKLSRMILWSIRHDHEVQPYGVDVGHEILCKCTRPVVFYYFDHVGQTTVVCKTRAEPVDSCSSTWLRVTLNHLVRLNRKKVSNGEWRDQFRHCFYFPSISMCLYVSYSHFQLI